VSRAPPCALPTSLGELVWRVRLAGPSIEAESVAAVAFWEIKYTPIARWRQGCDRTQDYPGDLQTLIVSRSSEGMRNKLLEKIGHKSIDSGVRLEERRRNGKRRSQGSELEIARLRL
jgi:hypothetical protein